MVEALMRRALRLAARGRGATSPNPMVGASVVASDGPIVGDGWHQRAGTSHAEVHALDAAGARARGALLVCTLEPCAHHGRTGPCVERIVEAGIARVVAATEDPNPLVAGRGFRYLQAHGIDVAVGVEAAAARRLNAPFSAAMRDARPWVILKAGVSLDGMIARAPGERTDITSPESRRAADRVRAEVDAVAVGIGTVLADDPWLTVRDVYRSRPFTRAVFDRQLRTPLNARLLTTLKQGPVVVLADARAQATHGDEAHALTVAGVQVAWTDGTLADGLRWLGGIGVQSLLLEGGARIHRAAWEAGMIDEVHLFVAPSSIGPGGVPFADGAVPISELTDVRPRVVGPDVLITGYVYRPH
jgi:diaminohydroxyphosphoribosylaminopyrimidine deaminase / 5-amino-6-(5-phosphoribosylamino)uracil reductase